jgi:oxygen-independent coproporphyrinogen-3 oxidase
MDAVVSGTLARFESLAGRFAAEEFRTLYVGGGTPSFLPRQALRRLLHGIGTRAASGVEWTVEANPESVDGEFLDLLEGEGVTRLSLGVQTFDDRMLSELGRPSDAASALSALRLASRRNLRLSADLIAGFEREGGLAEEAGILADEGCGHVSIYDLTLEPGTLLEGRWRKGDFALEDEDRTADERESAEEGLSRRGFTRYEVSNYALPGMEAEHNLVYWRMGSWLGVGPGASGTIARRSEGAARPGVDGGCLRIDEARSLEAYASESGPTAVETEVEPYDAAFEALMMAFRTKAGLDRGAFERRFGLDPPSIIGASLEKWRRHARREGGRLSLDGRGLDLLNSFLSDCLSEMEGTFPRRPGQGPREPSPRYTKKS